VHAAGHYGAALLLYAPVGYVIAETSPSAALVAGAGVLALATLPDADEFLPFVDHRGPTHSLVFLVVVTLALAGVGWTAGHTAVGHVADPGDLALVGALVGAVAVGSHLLADLVTPMGVNLLWPYRGPMLSLRLTYSRDLAANLALLLAGVCASAVAAYLSGPW
jgi:inner membrane protein